MSESDKKTVVIGASTKASRFSNTATTLLDQKGFEVVPVGIREGNISGIEILLGHPEISNVHTITLYINPTHQKGLYDYILGLKPKRIIFNPGTENPELIKLAKEQDVEVEIGCTLVMLNHGSY